MVKALTVAATLSLFVIPGHIWADTIVSTFGSGLSNGSGIELFNGPLREEVLGMGERFVVPRQHSYTLDETFLIASIPTAAENRLLLRLFVHAYTSFKDLG